MAENHDDIEVLDDGTIIAYVAVTVDGTWQRRITQNQNESINGVLWSKCPKTKFCGKIKVLLAVSETVMYFNTGAALHNVNFKQLWSSIVK